MTSTCEAATRVLPGAAVIELAGEVDGSAATVLTAAYEQAVGAAPDLGTVVLDFAAVDYINSTGIALIVSVLARARAERRRSSPAGSPRTTARSSTSPGCRTSSSSSLISTAPSASSRHRPPETAKTASATKQRGGTR